MASTGKGARPSGKAGSWTTPPMKKASKGGRKNTDPPRLSQSFMSVVPSSIKLKTKRAEVYQKQKREKNILKKEERAKRQREAEALGEEPIKKVAKTLDNMREADETLVAVDDEEVKADEAVDEFAPFFSGEAVPKILITTCMYPSKRMFEFVADLLRVFPGSVFYSRKRFPLQKVVEACKGKDFTDIVVINEDKKQFNGWTQIHLPAGPTAHFRLSRVVCSSEIPGHAKPGAAKPEVILNNFNTRLGHRVGRMLGALMHQEPQFRARRVVTFHNQRDFIFFRHHRYIFDLPTDEQLAEAKAAKRKEARASKKAQQAEEEERKQDSAMSREVTKAIQAAEPTARLQECGPRFTLKLKSLQHGTFDRNNEEYEWIHKVDMDTSRRRFFL